MITENECQHNRTIYSLSILRDIAFWNAEHYKWDPFVRELHEMYFEAADAIIKAHKETHNV